MTTYKALKGRKIKTLASDPPAAVSEGQVWYSSSAYDFKTSVFSEAWSSGGNLNITRGSLSGTGTLTAGLVVGGTTATVAFEDATEEYNKHQMSQLVQTLEQMIFVLNNTYVPQSLREEEERVSWFLS